MERIQKSSLVAPRWGVGVALMALCVFTPVLHADVIVFDTTSGSANSSSAGYSADLVGQSFIMSIPDGAISSLSLTFLSGSSGSAGVDLYQYISSKWTFESTLGTVGSSGVVSLSSAPTLLNGTTYAIVLDVASGGTLTWNATGASPTTGTVGFGSYGSMFTTDTTGTSGWQPFLSQSMQMQLSVVPEVPMTGILMGIGALAIAAGTTLRRKARLATSNIV